MEESYSGLINYFVEDDLKITGQANDVVYLEFENEISVIGVEILYRLMYFKHKLKYQRS